MLCALLYACTPAFAVQAGTLAQGVAAYQSGNYADAFTLLSPLAEGGEARAQFLLGQMYRRGEGFYQDAAEAAKWLTQAAQQGNASAQHSLGVMYEHGEGVAEDQAAALKWFRLSAEAGNTQAQLYLGMKYLSGDGVERDADEAAKWLRAAAAQNDADAAYLLGRMLLDGSDLTQDEAQAEHWLRAAAAQGHIAAQRFLKALQGWSGLSREDALRQLRQQLSAGTLMLTATSPDTSYGYSESNPVKVGGGAVNERRFLNTLRGPKGEAVHYRLLRSCCAFETAGGATGKDALHVYEAQYDGLEKPVILFLDWHDEDAPKAPAGFGYVRENF